jgi:hypothetical protein
MHICIVCGKKQNGIGKYLDQEKFRNGAFQNPEVSSC